MKPGVHRELLFQNLWHGPSGRLIPVQISIKNSALFSGFGWVAGVLCPCLLLALGVAPGVALAAGKADKTSGAAAPVAPAAKAPSEAEFEVVAAGDDLYRLLALVQRGGLLQSAPRAGATRYEMALETGRAALALASKRAARARVSEDSVRALSDLLAKLRPELRRLDVDVDAALSLCRTAQSGADVPVSALLSTSVGSDSGGSRGTKAGGSSASGSGDLASLLTPSARSLSERLRISAYADSRDRSLADPFGGASRRGQNFFGVSSRAGEAFFEPAHVGPRDIRSGLGSAGASVGVSDWLRVRAGFDSSAPSTQPSSLRVLGANSPDAVLLGSPDGSSRTVGGGVDIDLSSGLTLSGDVARTGSLGGGFERTRIGGQAQFSAFNDQLTLSLNLSRLLPEEREQAMSGASFNVGLGDKNRKLVLLYQQLFGPSSAGQSNRVIAGGVNITF